MLEALKRLALGLALIVAASAVLLVTDGGRRPSGSARRPRVAILQHASQSIIDEGVAGMIDALAEGGFSDGRTVSIRRFNAEGDVATANTIAREIAGGDYDLILTATTVSLQVVANANREARKPHVFALVTDPVAAGVGITGERPDQHPPYLVGYGTMQPVRETFELARKVFPGLRRVGEVWNPAEANSEGQTRIARQVCREMGIELVEANADGSAAVSEAARSLVARGVEAFWVPGDVTVMTAIDSVIGAAHGAEIPVFTSMPGSAQKGALFDVGAHYHEVGRIAGSLAAQVLRGADPATIGVTNVMPERVVINRTIVADLRDPWRFPPEVVASADAVIDAEGLREKAARGVRPSAVGAPGGAPLGRKWKIALLEYVNVLDVEEAERGIRAGLGEAGLVEGRDFELTVRNAQGDMATLTALADAALGDGADLLLTLSTPTLQAALQRARDVPIVFTFVADGVAAGAGRSNDDHLPNVTGVPTASAYEEQLALIRQCLPEARRLGTLFVPAEVNSEFSKKQIERLAPRYGFELVAVPVNTSAEVSDATLALLGQGVDAICQAASNLTTAAFASISEPARRARVPVFGFLTSDVRNGAVLVAARDYFDGGREAGALAARILRGESPASIPFKPLGSVRVLVNLAAARAVGMTIPRSILDRAQEIGEKGGG
jgi:ABC-type uncharacterized transport system substrate-binding protein